MTEQEGLTKDRLNGLRAAICQSLLNLNVAEKEQIVETAVSIADVIERQGESLGLANKPDLSALVRSISKSLASGTLLPVFAPSCPDYNHNSSVYVFGGVGKGVSLLAQYQVDFAKKLLPIFDMNGVGYEYLLLTADIEEQDSELLVRNNVDLASFRHRVRATIEATTEYLKDKIELKNRSIIRSAGFFDEFNDFIGLQNIFERRISKLRIENKEFGEKLGRIHIGRCYSLYVRTVGIGKNEGELMPRTIRTMAQYAALGHLARQRGAIITCHETLNASTYNDHRISLEDNPETAFIKVPIFNFGKRIY